MAPSRGFSGPRSKFSEHENLLSLTAYLALVLKWLSSLEKLYPDAFWLAVFGPDPVRQLGSAGFALLAFYVAGAAVWGIVTLGLAALVKVWAGRFCGRR